MTQKDKCVVLFLLLRLLLFDVAPKFEMKKNPELTTRVAPKYISVAASSRRFCHGASLEASPTGCARFGLSSALRRPLPPPLCRGCFRLRLSAYRCLKFVRSLFLTFFWLP
ncbi:hypothetical protein L596_020449 [Steinernema carpocapsae]|uniref:Secreted protein n=1 Tax=Steinernema carpocapsae TaxID=34508 RepID=A0A4U5MTS5_STECR|nr:hypothetical protein L596_020449 [Steinernema carpocapsae]